MIEDWMKRSTPVAEIHFDVVFVVNEKFLIDEDDDLVARRRNTMFRAIRTPNLPKVPGLVPGHVFLADVPGREEELVKYYRDVLKLSKKYTKERLKRRFRLLGSFFSLFKRRDATRYLQHYFWLRPLIFSLPDTVVYFPWSDTLGHTKRVMNDLLADKKGCLFFDGDQGWELTIQADRDSLFLLCRNPDEHLEESNISFSRAPFLAEVATASDRLKAVTDILKREVGRTFWR